MKKPLFFGALAILVFLSPVWAKGLPSYDVAQPQKIALSYNFYAGGFEAINAGIDLDLKPARYDMAMTVRTQNFIGNLLPWSGSYKVTGTGSAGKPPMPSRTDTESRWKGSGKTTRMEYSAGKPVKLTSTENGKTAVTQDFAADLLKGQPVDMMTAMLMIFENVDKTRHCAGSFPVFDGKRRFDLVLQDDGEEEIAKSKYSIFAGPALRCSLKMAPVAGFREKDMNRGWMAIQKHTESRGQSPAIWFAAVKKGGPFVPVRMQIASSYGAVIAHLVSAENR